MSVLETESKSGGAEGSSPDGANEHDVLIGYTTEAGSGRSFSLGATDNYFPSPGGSEFFDFSGDGKGLHCFAAAMQEPYLGVLCCTSFVVLTHVREE